jgi:hypothetical protein
VRTTLFQLVPPLVDRSSVPGVLQSPTVARHAVFSDMAKSNRCGCDGSTEEAEGVDSVEALGSGELLWLIDADGDGVSSTEAELAVTAGWACSAGSGRSSSTISATLAKIRHTSTTLGSNLVVRRTG